MRRVLLCGSVEVLARGLESCLVDAELVATVPVPEAAAAIPVLDPDLVLVDFGPECTYQVLSELTRAGVPVVLWVSAVPPVLCTQAVSLGVRGILRKSLGADMVNRCVAKVSDGEVWFEQDVTQTFLAAERTPLTNRESTIIERIARGWKNGEIASDLKLSEGSVKVYLSKIFLKLKVKDRYELALWAIKNLGDLDAVPGARGSLRTFVVDRPRAA